MLQSSIQGTATVNKCQLKLMHREKLRQQGPILDPGTQQQCPSAPLSKDQGWEVQSWDSAGQNCKQGAHSSMFSHIIEHLPSYPSSPDATNVPGQLEAPCTL